MIKSPNRQLKTLESCLTSKQKGEKYERNISFAVDGNFCDNFRSFAKIEGGFPEMDRKIVLAKKRELSEGKDGSLFSKFERLSPIVL